jgi:hypothetical protein
VSRDAGGAYQVSCFGKRTLRLHGRKVASSKLELGDQFQIGRSRFDLRG